MNLDSIRPLAGTPAENVSMGGGMGSQTVATELEGIFLRWFFKDAMPRLGGEEGGSSILREMLLDGLARVWAERGGIGLSASILPSFRPGEGPVPGDGSDAGERATGR